MAAMADIDAIRRVENPANGCNATVKQVSGG